MGNTIDVYVRVFDSGKIPQYATNNAAGCDLYATQDMEIRPGESKIMPLNFIMAINEDMEAQIRPRSGLSLKTSLRISNSPGTIDSDYRNTVGVILENTFSIANLPYQIAQDPRILEQLQQSYREMELGEYLVLCKGVKLNQSDALEIAKHKIYIDDKDNPYGTIYIKNGERIAQMVFCRYRKANFIQHPNPCEIGHDRGGGYGHTGSL